MLVIFPSFGGAIFFYLEIVEIFSDKFFDLSHELIIQPYDILRHISRQDNPQSPLKKPLNLHNLLISDTMVPMLTKRVKSKISGDLGKHDKDTGSAAVQIGLLTREIEELTLHLKKNPKDNHSRRGLLKMVSRRRKFIDYMKKKDLAAYEKLAKKLELKK